MKEAVTISMPAQRAGSADTVRLVAAAGVCLAAKLRVVFEPERKGRAEKRVMVELKAPDRSNLRDQTERHRLIAETLLARWGLYADVT